MHVNQIRDVARRRPFQIFKIHIDNGDKYLIPNPENIMVANTFIVIVDRQGDAVLITPESIKKIITFKRKEKYQV